MNIIARNRLLFSLSVCFMIVLVSISSVSGKNEINKQIVDDKILESSLLPSWLLLLVNGDWNYWDNQPNIYAIPTGNVGIGTDDPNEKLTVAGIIESTQGGFKFPDGTIQTSASSGGGGESAWAWWSGTGISGDIYRIGNVGIGAITPTDKLDVDGGIRASYIRAQSNENLEFKTDEGATRLNITDDGDISAEYNTIRKYYGFPRPDYESGWLTMGEEEYDRVITHSLGLSVDNYVIDVQYGNPPALIYPGTGVDRHYNSPPINEVYNDYGYSWRQLTEETITIYRGDDEYWRDFRVRIWTYY